MNSKLAKAAASLCLLALSGCDNLAFVEGDIIVEDIRNAIALQEVPAAGILGDLLDLTGYRFGIDEAIGGRGTAPKGAKFVALEGIWLRTVLDDALDRTDSALKDEELYSRCRPGQKPISFIYSLDILIRKKGQPDAAYQRIAQFRLPEEKQGAADVCGIQIPTDRAINLLDFLPEYEIKITASARAPREKTLFAGFVKVFFHGSMEANVDTLKGNADRILGGGD